MNWSAIWEWIRSWQLGALAAWVAIVPSVISAATARKQARKSASSARDAREALAVALRPIFAFGGTEKINMLPLTTFQIDLNNTSPSTAVDVSVKVTTRDGTIVGSITADRIEGTIPHTLIGDPDLAFDVSVPEKCFDNPKKLTLTVTVRSADEHGIQMWEQRSVMTWEAQPHDKTNKPRLEIGEIIHRHPVKYNKAN